MLAVRKSHLHETVLLDYVVINRLNITLFKLLQ